MKFVYCEGKCEFVKVFIFIELSPDKWNNQVILNILCTWNFLT